MTNVSGEVFPTIVQLDVQPATGSTTTMPPNYNAVLFTDASTRAAQTVVLPANPVDGQMFYISTYSAITALTLSPTVKGVPSGLAAGGGLMLMYRNTLTSAVANWFVFR